MSGWWQASLCRFNARVPSRHRRGREHSHVLFTQHDQRPSAVSDMISFGASDGEIDDSLFFWRLRTRRCVRALWLTLPSQRCLLHVTPDSDEELICIMTKVVNELGLEWSPLRSHLAAECFLTGRYQSPPPMLVPLLPRSSYELTILWGALPLLSHLSFCFSCSHIRWRLWRKGIRAPATSGWVCGRTSLPAHSFRMKGEGEPFV